MRSDLFARIENNISDIICVHSPDGRYKYITPSVKTVLGYTPEELIGSFPHELFHPDDMKEIETEDIHFPYQKATAAARTEYRRKRKDGSYAWLQTQVTPIVNGKGSVVEFLSVSRDIGDQKQAQQALQESETIFQHLFIEGPAAKMLLDPDTGNIIDANQAAADFYGFPVDEIRGKTLFDFSAVPAAAAQAAFAAMGDPDCQPIPLTHRLKDGSLKQLEVYSRMFLRKEREVLYAVFIDVTARKLADEELRESRERLSLVIEGAKAGIWDYDFEHKLLHIDRRWKEMLGYEEHELAITYEEWPDWVHPDDVGKINNTVQDYLSEKSEKFEVRHRLRHKNGSYRWIFSLAKVTRDANGQPTRLTGLNIDITDEVRAEELYLESEKRLRDFAEAVPDASYIIDEDGRYVEVFGDEKMFAVPKEHFRGKTLHQVLPIDDANLTLNEVRLTIASGKPRHVFREMQAGTNKRYFSGRTVPLSYVVAGRRTAALIATDVTEQRRIERMLQMAYELRRRSDFINDILNGKVVYDETFIYLSQKAGLDLNAPLFICKLISNKFSVGGSQTDIFGGSQKLKDSLIDAIGEIPECMAWDCSEGIGILCQTGFKADEWKKSKETAGLIRSKLLEIDPSLSASIGVSNMHTGVEGLKKSCRQAFSAALAARYRWANDIGITHYREAGIFQFMPELAGGETARDYIEQHIGRLIDHDREKQTDYLSTLEELLRGATIRETSEKQFLHPKTVAFRQRRITEMLNVDFSDYQSRLTIALALQLHKMRKQEPAIPTGS